MEGVAHNETLRVMDIMDNKQAIIPIEVVERGTSPPTRADACTPEKSQLFVFQDRELQAEVDAGKDAGEVGSPASRQLSFRSV
jgi:hypothetical protein